jgi:hypothetical protein
MAEIKHTEKDLLKKPWHSPKLFQLDFKETKGGPSPGHTEDSYDNSPVS